MRATATCQLISRRQTAISHAIASLDCFSFEMLAGEMSRRISPHQRAFNVSPLPKEVHTPTFFRLAIAESIGRDDTRLSVAGQRCLCSAGRGIGHDSPYYMLSPFGG